MYNFECHALSRIIREIGPWISAMVYVTPVNIENLLNKGEQWTYARVQLYPILFAVSMWLSLVFRNSFMIHPWFESQENGPRTNKCGATLFPLFWNPESITFFPIGFFHFPIFLLIFPFIKWNKWIITQWNVK